MSRNVYKGNSISSVSMFPGDREVAGCLIFLSVLGGLSDGRYSSFC